MKFFVAQTVRINRFACVLINKILWSWMDWPRENSSMAFWFRRTISLEINQEPYWNKIKIELLVHSLNINRFTRICNDLSYKQIWELFKVFKPSIVDSRVNENDFEASNHMNMMARHGIYFYCRFLATQSLTQTSAIIKWHAIHFETELVIY